MACGIYAIVHVDTNDRYVGQSKEIHRRWRDHKRALDAGSAHSTVLQEAWRVHGSKKFRFEILELCEPEALDALEFDHMQRGAALNDTLPMVVALNADELIEETLADHDSDLAKRYQIHSIDDLKRMCRLVVDIARHVEALTMNISHFVADTERLQADRLIDTFSNELDDHGNSIGPMANEILIRLDQIG